VRLFAKSVVTFVVTILFFGLAWINSRPYTTAADPNLSNSVSSDIVPQLQNIGRRLREGEGRQMQSLYPEGWFFSHLLYGFAWVNVGLQTNDNALHQRAVTEARWVMEMTNSRDGVAPFQQDTQVPNGVFYLGWKNRLLGGLLKLLPEQDRLPQEVLLFHRQSETLAKALSASPTLHLDAYPGQSWPCDNVIAIASLKLHDELYATDYHKIASAWVSFTQKHLDPVTGLIVHQINAQDGSAVGAPRGSTQVYIHSFLPEVDPAFARQQYISFRKAFVIDVLGYYPVREYPKGSSGVGDVDSGPLFFGLSPSATVVSIAAARANGDLDLFTRNVALSEAFGVPYSSVNEKSYALGKIVVADTFLAWGKSLVPWRGPMLENYSSYPHRGWMWRVHLLSGVIAGLCAVGLKRLWKKRPAQNAHGY
jgi:hypothetical protein